VNVREYVEGKQLWIQARFPPCCRSSVRSSSLRIIANDNCRAEGVGAAGGVVGPTRGRGDLLIMAVLAPLARLALVGLGLLGTPACARGFQPPLRDPSFQQPLATAAPGNPLATQTDSLPAPFGVLRAHFGVASASMAV
jgi:hypothetical protein